MSLRVLPDMLDEAATRFETLPAVQGTVSSGGVRLSYGALRARARRGAAVLRAAGLRDDDRVLLVMDGCPEWSACFFAILAGGFVAVPAAPGTSQETLLAIARHAGAKACIHDPRSSSALGGMVSLTPETLFAPGTEAAACPAVGEDLALLAFTSGSSAAPRAVELTHAGLLAELDALLAVRPVGPEDALLSVLPPAHPFELVAGLLAPLRCGARVVYPGSLLPERLVEALREERITRALAAPALVEALCAEVPGELARRIGSTFRTLGVGGAALDPIRSELLGRMGIALEVGYGLTEAGPIVSLALASECPPGSVGRPLPSVTLRVDEEGEILVRAPHVMRGYFRDPEGTAQVLRDGWLHTGDRGSLDAGGFLFVHGRLKEALVSDAGETLYPEEVEPYYASPLFRELCVVPLRGPQGKDVPALVVVPAHPGTAQEEIERTVARLRAEAPARCRVAAIVRLERPLPRTALGKIERRAIAQGLAAGKKVKDRSTS